MEQLQEQMQKKERVYISDYLESRRYNKTLYSKLITSIRENCKFLFKAYPDVEIRITMSAKTGNPRIVITENDNIPLKVGTFEREIMYALNEVGFEFEGSENSYNYYIINFND